MAKGCSIGKLTSPLWVAPEVPRGTGDPHQKSVSDRFSIKLTFFRTPVSLRSGSEPPPTKMINAIGEPKVLYYPDLFSAHGAPPGNSFVQCITNPLCDALHEGIFSKASPGRDQIVKPCRSGPIMADRTMKGRKADEGAFLRPLRAITSYLSSSCYSCRSSFLSSSESTSPPPWTVR